jgi:hypothetical protein
MGRSGKPLVLVCGLPRSGTTWLGKILDSHPGTLYRHEPDSWGRLNFLPLVASADEVTRHRQELEDFVTTLPRMTQTKVVGTLPVFRKRSQSSATFAIQWVLIGMGKLFSKLAGEWPIPSVTNTRNADYEWIIWKSIESVGRMGPILGTVANAKGVLIVRHPCGYVASVLRGERQNRFTSKESASEDYGVFRELLKTKQARDRGLSVDAIRSMDPVERLSLQWALLNDSALVETKDRDRLHIICYETLCKNPFDTAKKLFEWIGMDWNSQSEQFLQDSTSSEKEGYYSVFKRSDLAAYKWERELDEETQERICTVARDSLTWRHCEQNGWQGELSKESGHLR